MNDDDNDNNNYGNNNNETDMCNRYPVSFIFVYDFH